MLGTLIWLLIKAIIVAVTLLTSAALFLLFFRKGMGYFQLRYGPNRVGPWGVLQPVADVVKMLFKEDIVPRDADKMVYKMAPMVAFFTAIAGWAVIPWGPTEPGGLQMQLADVGVGILFVLAISSLSVYGVALGGWASQSKYSLLGSLRSTAQMISYELSMGMAIIGVVLMAQSVKLTDIVSSQAGLYFIIPQALGFCVFFVSALAEAAWTPFDLPESEAELVGGYNTEYAGMRWGLFFLSELVHAINGAVMISLLYLGGWNRIFLFEWMPPTMAFVLKVMLLLFVFIWIRSTLPRFRYDRLMSFGWKVMLPLAALNLVGTAVYIALWAPKA